MPQSSDGVKGTMPAADELGESLVPVLSAGAKIDSEGSEWFFKWIMVAQAIASCEMRTVWYDQCSSCVQVAVYMEAGAVPALLNELVHVFKMSYGCLMTALILSTNLSRHRAAAQATRATRRHRLPHHLGGLPALPPTLAHKAHRTL